MDDREVARYWDENADTWTTLTRMGCDLLRDHVNTPAFMAMLADVKGLRGLDLGCGEGHSTRLLAGRGARMSAIDVSPRMVEHARQEELRAPLGIDYHVGTALDLPFAAEAFDFIVGVMSFMDIPDHARLVAEARRVLKPGGFLQFSISHPCFATPRWRWLLDSAGNREAMVCGDYFQELNGNVEQWMFSAAPPEAKARLPEFRIPRFTRTLSNWLNLLLDAGFVLERFDEPCADEETIERHPILADTRVIAYALIVRCCKSRSDGEKPA